MEKVLTKSEFMALAINDYYKKRFDKREKARLADTFIIGRNASERDRKLKKRGF